MKTNGATKTAGKTMRMNMAADPACRQDYFKTEGLL